MRTNIPNQPHYSLNEWEIVEEQFEASRNYTNETIFALGNGFLGMRGTFEEGYSGPEWSGLEGNYINGFYETERIKYPETAYGYASKSQTMLNVTNGKVIRLMVGDEEFSMLTGSLSEYRRAISFRDGILRRSLLWTSPKGRKVRIEIERVVSLRRRHVAAIRYRVTPLNFRGVIRLISVLDGDVRNQTAVSDPRVGSGLVGRVLAVREAGWDGDLGLLVQETRKSGLILACAMQNRIESGVGYTVTLSQTELRLEAGYEFSAREGQGIQLDKFLAYVTSRECSPDEVAARVKDELRQALKAGVDGIIGEQRRYLEGFWERSDIVIQGDPAIQQGIRFNLFHLLQSVGRDGMSNIAAKGLTGEGYEGHYFWDTETYILPFFLYTTPEISRSLLEYRYHILDKARERARQMSHPKGALFPWRTIDGEECSAYFPAGTAQYHINADIAFAIKRYMEATGDREFLIRYGAEILFETARFWADLGEYIPRKGNRFCINMVTGPDEYSALVNNNCYTNMMARENLEYGYRTACRLRDEASEEYQRIATAIGLGDEEPEVWKAAADRMYIPYDDELGIYLQDDGFLDRVPWDFEHTPPENYPLLLHYHPLVIYRHQVCKQADLIMALFLLSDRFTLEEKRRNYEFYEKVTTHDSSLSTSIFSIVACEIGSYQKAYRYFTSTARLDLDDYTGNTRDGIHAANMAGTWMCLVYGFAGMRVENGTLSFHPYLPEGWEEYRFKLTFQGRLIGVKVNRGGATFELIHGEPIEIVDQGKKIVLE